MFKELPAELISHVGWIDTQHKNMFKHANQFLSAVEHRKGQQEIGSAIKLLENYSHSHFATEEKYMIENNYSLYKAHKTEHGKFMKVIEYIRNEYAKYGAQTELVEKIKTVFIRYLEDHVEQFDKPLALFLNQRLKKE